ncbi:hypothetical protein AVEN_263750-1 [Araneus ventricosus]|uniref:Uncharacterized protein n=1 Tax=Araneus ventricosus TaxID=182803 RepID=A0A4Y2AU26_ARAVE|nr:hypothetical protein AVEN_263750-1 [Araneus ventricosus]
MSSKRKSPPSKLSTDGLNNDHAAADPFRSDQSDIDDVLRADLADKILAGRISQEDNEENHLLDQNDNKINYHKSSEGGDLINKLNSDEFHAAVQGFNNTRLEIDRAFDSLDVSQLPKNATSRPETSLNHDHDSCDSLTSDGVLVTEHSQKDSVTPSSRKHRLLLSVSSTRSETTSDSEYDSESCMNGNDPISGTFPCDFLQASLKASNPLNENNNGPRDSPDSSHSENNFHYPYPLQPEMAKSLSGGQGKRTMDDVLRRLTSKITSSATLSDRHTPGPASLIIAEMGERDFFNRSPTSGRVPPTVPTSMHLNKEIPAEPPLSVMDNDCLRLALAGDNIKEKERCLTDMINQLQHLKEQLVTQQTSQVSQLFPL